MRGEVFTKSLRTHACPRSFVVARLRRVFDEEGDWFEGKNQEGKSGCFPSEYASALHLPLPFVKHIYLPS